MADAVLLDTCACLWLTHGEPMSRASRRAIRGAQTSHVGVHVSAVTAWEVATLVSKGRYRLFVSPQVWFARLLALAGVRLATLTPEILIDSAFLPGEPPKDPADRMIAATARQHGLTVISRDRGLVAYAKQDYLRLLAC
jgi:PIN domain nuclease of toxin-antitoxin system